MTDPSLTGRVESMTGSPLGHAAWMSGPHPAGPGAIRLGRMLLHRELDPVVFDLLVGAAVGVGAARLAAAATEDTVPGVVMTALRNFNTTVAIVLAVLLILRVAVREGDDRRDGWLGPLIAAGAARWHYGVALPATVLIRALLTFAAAAIAFAIGVRVFASSTELVSALPRTLGAGLLFLASFTACTAPLAFALRNVGGTVATTLAIALLPNIPAMVDLMRHAEISTSSARILMLTPLRPPSQDLLYVIYDVIYVIVGMALAAAAAHRFAGRRP